MLKLNGGRRRRVACILLRLIFLASKSCPNQLEAGIPLPTPEHKTANKIQLVPAVGSACRCGADKWESNGSGLLGLSSKASEMAIGMNRVEGAGLFGFGTSASIGELADARRAMVVGFSLALLQALDGVLTSMGVSRFGTGAEGNPILRFLMEEFGQLPILGIVKTIAIFFVLALSIYARRLAWVRNAMGAISAIYLFTAIIPWTYILFIQTPQ